MCTDSNTSEVLAPRALGRPAPRSTGTTLSRTVSGRTGLSAPQYDRRMTGTGALWWWVPAVYMVLSLITAAAYSRDKRAAVAGSWRVSERTLLVLGLIGGWPGGLLAQRALRHKIRKAGFMALFWTTVVVNLACLALAVVYFRP